ncbi:MAG: DinB family protein [Bryobacteraceae bacterium]
MLPEPWLRGPIEGVNPLVAPALRTFEQTREDLRQATEGLTSEQVWARPFGMTAVGFHLRHIAGSTERLCNYLDGEQLSEQQIAAMKREDEPGATLEELLTGVDAALDKAAAQFRGLDPATYSDPRGVGRKMLPTTVMGLVLHIAEHTFRHVGQAVAAAKLVRAVEGGAGARAQRHSTV